MDLHKHTRGEVHLEVKNTDGSELIRIEGKRIDVIFAWMQLTTLVAKKAGIPLPSLLAQCALLGKEIEEFCNRATSCKIDLSTPGRGRTN